LGASSIQKKEEVIQASDLPVDEVTSPDTITAKKLFDNVFSKENIEVTEEDKRLYLKALLNDTELSLVISLFNDKFTVKVKARSDFTQHLIVKVLDAKAVEENESNMLIINNWIQSYAMAVMVVSINDKEFPVLDFKPGVTVAEAKKLLDTAVEERFTNLGFKYDIILRALHLFEVKKTKMQDACLNANFWMTVDSN